jgi:transcription factor WhiB
VSTAYKHPPRFPEPAFAEHLPGIWVLRAACRGKADVMDATGDRDRTEALRICRGCPVLAECIDWVTGLPPEAPVHGTVAGMDPDERARLRAGQVAA